MDQALPRAAMADGLPPSAVEMSWIVVDDYGLSTSRPATTSPTAPSARPPVIIEIVSEPRKASDDQSAAEDPPNPYGGYAENDDDDEDDDDDDDSMYAPLRPDATLVQGHERDTRASLQLAEQRLAQRRELETTADELAALTPAARTPHEAACTDLGDDNEDDDDDDVLDISADAVHVAFTIRETTGSPVFTSAGTNAVPMVGKAAEYMDDDKCTQCSSEDDDGASLLQLLLDYYGSVTIRVVPLALSYMGVMLVTSLATYAGVCGLQRRSVTNSSTTGAAAVAAAPNVV